MLKDGPELQIEKAKYALNYKKQFYERQKQRGHEEINKQYMKDYQQFQKRIDKIDLELAQYAV